jgi:hypothetical protein
MPMGSDGQTLRFGLCNGGKVNIFISGLSVDYSWRDEDSYRSCSAGTTICSHKLLKPGDIAEHTLPLTSPRDEILEHVPLSENDQGVKERKLNISVYIQFAFPDGKIYSNNFCLGEHTVSEDRTSKGYLIYGSNLDLMNRAMPVENQS